MGGGRARPATLDAAERAQRRLMRPSALFALPLLQYRACLCSADVGYVNDTIAATPRARAAKYYVCNADSPVCNPIRAGTRTACGDRQPSWRSYAKDRCRSSLGLLPKDSVAMPNLFRK